MFLRAANEFSLLFYQDAMRDPRSNATHKFHHSYSPFPFSNTHSLPSIHTIPLLKFARHLFFVLWTLSYKHNIKGIFSSPSSPPSESIFSTAPATRTFYASIYSTDWYVFILLAIRKWCSSCHLRPSPRRSGTIGIRSVWQNHGTVHRRKSIILSIASCISWGFLRQRNVITNLLQRMVTFSTVLSRRNGCGKLSAPERKQHAGDFLLELHLLD